MSDKVSGKVVRITFNENVEHYDVAIDTLNSLANQHKAQYIANLIYEDRIRRIGTEINSDNLLKTEDKNTYLRSVVHDLVKEELNKLLYSELKKHPE